MMSNRLALQLPIAAGALPKPWYDAQVVALWDAQVAEFGHFAANRVEGDWPESLLRNIERPVMRLFRPKRPNGRAILVIPGGGYKFISALNEGWDIAHRLQDRGYLACVLMYRRPCEGWLQRADAPLQDAQRAMRILRSRAKQYDIDPEQIIALGFSAGGHLAASLATNFSEPTYGLRDEADLVSARPAAVGLLYPVITLTGPYRHHGSAESLLGNTSDVETVAKRSPELNVKTETPPAFLVHAFDDNTVDVENSMMMLRSLRAAAIPAEAHFLEEGGHAFGVGGSGSPSGEWLSLFLAWLDRRFLDCSARHS